MPTDKGIPRTALSYLQDVNEAIVRLSEAQLSDAAALAAGRYRRYSGPGTYGRGGYDSDLVGSLGEVAVEHWLRTRCDSVTSNFRYSSLDSSRPDLKANLVGVEIKTWRAGTWGQKGRSLEVSQLSAIVEHSHAVLFCWLAGPVEDPVLHLAGWLPVADALAFGVPVLRGVRAQIQVPLGYLRPVDELVSWSESAAKRAELASAGHCEHGHATFNGYCWTCAVPEAERWVIVSETDSARAFHRGRIDEVRERHGDDPFRSTWRIRAFGDVVASRRPCLACYPHGSP